MRDQADEGEDKKLSTAQLEDAAQEHAADFEEAWEMLEVARMVFEKAGNEEQVGNVRLSLVRYLSFLLFFSHCFRVTLARTLTSGRMRPKSTAKPLQSLNASSETGRGFLFSCHRFLLKNFFCSRKTVEALFLLSLALQMTS